MSILNFILEIYDMPVVDNKTTGSNTPQEIGNTMTINKGVFVLIIMFLVLFFVSTLMFWIKEDRRRKAKEKKQMKEELKEELKEEIKKEYQMTENNEVEKSE